MCLSVPGKIISITSDELMPTGRVQFGEIVKEVSLAFTPDIKVGEYVLVHAGVAINKISEDDALQVFEYLEQIV